MPELPEVETMCRGVAAVCGQQVARVSWPRGRFRPVAVHPSRAEIRRRLPGKRIAEVLRRGKFLVLRMEDDSALVLHPRMTGLVLLEEPPDREHLRLVLELAGPGPKQLRFWDRRGLGTVEYHPPGQWRQALGPPRLGPDALEISCTQMRRRLGTSRRAIKVALLEQSRIAGLGNLYASEILFVARVDPRSPCYRLSDAQWRRLHRAMRRVLHEAIRYEGSTLGDGTYRTALNQPGRYQNRHRVYGKAGQPCPRCRTKLVRVVQQGRSTFFCPACQSDA